MVIICSNFWIFCLFICVSLSLVHSFTVASLESFFILSLRLTMPAVSLCCSPRYNCRWRSLLMRALSHSGTYHSGDQIRIRNTDRKRLYTVEIRRLNDCLRCLYSKSQRDRVQPHPSSKRTVIQMLCPLVNA